VGAVIAGVLALALAQQPPAATSGENATEFSKLEEMWNQAHLHGDADALDRLWSDDIVVIVPKMPPFSKTAALSVFRSGRMKFGRYATSDISVRRYEGCVVVTGRLQRSRTMGERAVDDDWRFTKVYVRGPKGWQVVTFHASETGP
jgi:ketosteroid isomerase-like protein